MKTVGITISWAAAAYEDYSSSIVVLLVFFQPLPREANMAAWVLSRKAEGSLPSVWRETL